MAITPNTNIRLLKVPIAIDNKNQLTFNSVNEQTAYFSNLNMIEIDHCSYQRKDNIIRFPSHIDNIINYNYVMYQNTNYLNKWFYAFITNMEYLNDNTTLITIKTDTFQTWQFDITYKQCFVEREHVNDDTIGMHTVDENLNVGEVIEETESEDISLSQYSWVAISSSWNPSTEKQFSGITVFNDIVYGNEIHLIKTEPISNLLNFVNYLSKTNADKHIEDIKDVFLVPDALIDETSLTLQTGTVAGMSFSFYLLPFSENAQVIQTQYNKVHSFTSFSPKNNKCFVYPYNYLLVSNNIGNHNIYKYEDFSTNNINFEIQLALSIGGSGRLVPKNYKGIPKADDEALPLAKFPVCGWSVDSYTNWLTKNSINISLQIFNSVMAPISSINSASNNYNRSINDYNNSKNKSNFDKQQIEMNYMSNIASTTVNSINQVANTIDTFKQASLLPNIEGVQPTGDVNYSAKRNTFTFHFMRAKNEYLQAIDNYFSIFGYKVNTMKIPNITGRPNWNYVKTIDSIITGNIPQLDLQEIKLMLDNGITFWHNPSTFLDYSQSNSII